MYPNRIVCITASSGGPNSRFIVNLKTGPHANNDTAFHFSGRFDQKMVVRNTQRNGVWEKEEKEMPHGFPLQPMQEFELMIKAEFDHFKCTVNGLPLTNYNYRMPVTTINTIHMDGDVRVKRIKFIQS
jgi:hypothetical protein